MDFSTAHKYPYAQSSLSNIYNPYYEWSEEDREQAGIMDYGTAIQGNHIDPPQALAPQMQVEPPLNVAIQQAVQNQTLSPAHQQAISTPYMPTPEEWGSGADAYGQAHGLPYNTSLFKGR